MRLEWGFLLLSLCSCTQKMGVDGHLRPYAEPAAFPPGTIARGALGSASARIPSLKRGRERFEIYCAPCHGLGGYGDGMIVQRGFTPPPSFHSEELRKTSDGAIFQVITNGYGRMASYSDRVSVPDRRAIVAYIRALQFSQNAPVKALNERDRRNLEELHE